MFYDRNLQYCCVMNHRYFLLLICSVCAFPGRQFIEAYQKTHSNECLSHILQILLNWRQEMRKHLATAPPPISLQKFQKMAGICSMFSGHMAKSKSFHSTSSKAATTVRISIFIGSLSAPKLSEVFSFCLQSIFSDSPFAFFLSETTEYLKFLQVSLCVYGFGRAQDSK